MLTDLRLSFIDLLHDRSRSLLSIIGLGVVLFSFLILTSLASAVQNFLSNTTPGYNLVVVRANIFDPSDETLAPAVIEAAQALQQTGEISQVAPLVFRHTRLDDRMVQLRSADFATWQPVFHLQLLRGKWPGPSGELLLGDGLANAYKMDVGSKVQVFGREFNVSGIFRAPGSLFASVWIPLEAARDLFGAQRGYQGMYVQVAPGVDPLGIRDRLQNDPRLKDEYAVYLEDSFTRQNLDRLKGLSSLMRIASLLSLLGIVFGVSNTVAMSIIERSHDLGILLGLGFSTGSLARLIWLRFLILSLLAYIPGAGLALLYTGIQQAVAPFYILEFPISLNLTTGILLDGLGWMLALTLAGAWLSTWGFSRQRVMELIRSV